jgi:replicative DNA helicase Mcm
MKDKGTEFNAEDGIIYALGAGGVTENTFVESSRAWEIISIAQDKSISTAKRVFYNAVEKEILIKVGSTSSSYGFTKAGFERYLLLKKRDSVLEGASRTFEEFLRLYYWDSLLSAVNGQAKFLDIKFSDIELGLGGKFADVLIDFPDKILQEMENILGNMVLPTDSDYRPALCIVDLGKTNVVSVEGARDERYLQKLIEVEGRVMTQFEVKPRFLILAYQCRRCGHITQIPQTAGKIIEPFECDNDVCGRRGPFVPEFSESTRINSQEIILENERGQVHLNIILDDPLCTSNYEVRDAKMVRIVGVLDFRRVDVKGSAEYNFVFRAKSIRLKEDSNVEPPTQEEVELFETWAKNPVDIRSRLIQSVAPHIYGRETEKDALCLSMFSDWTWKLPAKKMLVRSSLHILIIGDPGTSKSEMLKDIAKIAPKAIEGQGENATGRGLSNSATQENGIWVIKAGLFAKADGGLVVLDELDKVKKEDLVALNSILVSQKQIADKAGLHVEFDTRCAAVCGANPKNSHIDIYEPIINQLGLNSFLFQRFDLIFVIVDRPDKISDGLIYDKIHEACNNASLGDAILNRAIPLDLIKKYIIYARTKPEPIITPDADAILKAFYIGIRSGIKRDDSASNYPAISARTAAALNKLTKAIARRELATEATVDHAQYAISMYRKSILSVGMGKEEDMMALDLGGTGSQFKRINDIRDVLIRHKSEDGVTISQISKWTGYPEIDVSNLISRWKNSGELIEVSHGIYRWI